MHENILEDLSKDISGKMPEDMLERDLKIYKKGY